METWSTPPPLIISAARSVKRVSLPSSASLFCAHGGISALFRCRFSAADSRSGTMLFPADFFRDLRVRARMGNFADFPDLTRGSLFPGCHLTFSAAIFTRIFPFGPFRAVMCHLHGMPAAAWIEATREPTPAPRTVQPAARQQGTDARSTSPADRMNGSTLATCTEGTADRRQRAPHRENVTRSRSRRRTTTSTRRGIDPWQVYPGSNEGPEKARNAPMKPAFIVSPSHVPPAANAGEGHTRGRLTSGTSPGSPAGNANWCNWRQLRRSHAADTDRSTPGTAEGPQKARSRFYIVCMVTNTTALYKRPKSHLRGRSSF